MINFCSYIVASNAIDALIPNLRMKGWELVEKFEEISNTFFFQTMPSIPPTRTAMREAASLLEVKLSGDWATFETQIVTLISSAQTVIEKAGMKGTTLT